MKFDPTSARAQFAEKDTDDLIRIAFLEPSYVTEAVDVAKEELARRGLSRVGSRDIERVRGALEAQRIAKEDDDLRSLEIDEAIPGWRRAVRSRLAPHRRPLSLLALAFMGLLWLNSIFDWGFLNLHGRRSEALAALIGSVWFVFVMPSQREFREMRKTRDGKTE